MTTFFIFACMDDKTIASDTGKISSIPSDTEPPSDTGIEDSDIPDDTALEDSGNNVEPEPPSIVRFVALGDGGEGNQTQYDVADAMKSVCEAKSDSDQTGCEFALYLGDNIYDVGVDSVTDPQFEEKFELPYQNIDFPFYVVLGNHDYGGWGSGFEFHKSEYQIDYSYYSNKWTMPSEYYDIHIGHLSLFALDTNALMWDPWFNTGAGQDSWLDAAIASSSSEWKIAFGHHPYISNGQHGNAGSYEGIDFIDWAIAEVPLGTAVEEFMSNHLCGSVDIYFSGHDHNRQFLEPRCGTEFIVSGTAAKTTDLQNRGNPSFFEDDQKAGFMWVELRDNCFTGEFYDSTGQLDFTHHFCK